MSRQTENVTTLPKCLTFPMFYSSESAFVLHSWNITVNVKLSQLHHVVLDEYKCKDVGFKFTLNHRRYNY